MKGTYFGKNTKTVRRLNELIKIEEDKLERMGRFGPNPDSFLEKYVDPFFDSYEETEADWEVSNIELLKSFEIAYRYLFHLRQWVGLEEEWLLEEEERKEQLEKECEEWAKMSWIERELWS